MGQFDIIYTGVNSAARIPELGILQRAEERFYDTIARKDELATERAKQNEQEYLAAMKNDPVYLVAGKNQQIQSDAIENYNNKWGKVFMQRNGRLTTQDKLDMQKDKMALNMMQQGLLSDQQRYLSDKETMQKDIRGFYNKDVFRQAEQDYLKTGKYSSTPLIAAPQDFVTAIKRMNLKYTEVHSTVTEEVGGIGWKRDVTTNMTLDEAKRVVADQILSNEGYLMKVLQDANDPSNAKELDKYLMNYDTNKNGIIDPKEKKAALDEPMNLNNPIIMWAQDHYGPQIITSSVGTSKRITSGVQGAGSRTLNYGGGNVKYAPPVGEQAVLGSTNYNFFPWYKKTPMNIPLNGARILKESGDQVLNRDQSVQGLDMVGIGKRADGSIEFIFKLPSDNYMNLGQPAGTNVAVPAEKMPMLQDITVEDNGKLVRVKDLMGGTQTSKPKSKSGVSWK